MISLFRRNNKCPYCGEVLQKVPKRSAKCKSCKNQIYVEGGKLLTIEGYRQLQNNQRAQDNKNALRKLASEGIISHVRVMTANDNHVCEQCRQLSNQVISVNEALSQMPIPHKCTSDLGCRCFYSPVVK